MLSPLKLVKILSDYRKRKTMPREMPIRMWVESSSSCNLRCVMCPNKDLASSEKGNMDYDLFRKIADEAKGFVNDMYLHHRGEPLMNPRLADMIKYAADKGINTRFHTNGTLMDETWTERLLEAKPDLISFSVDGFEKNTYERIRVGANFEKTVDNILRLVARRRERRQRKPYVVVEKIRFRDQLKKEYPEEVKKLWDRFLKAGVDEVIEKDEYVWAEETAPEPETRRQLAVCTFPWYAMVILSDGTVTPCPQDFAGKMKMGNVSKQSLHEIWNSAAYVDLRDKFTSDLDSLALCRKCDRLHRKTIGGIPFQYLATFLIDHLVGYNRLRKVIGTSER